MPDEVQFNVPLVPNLAEKLAASGIQPVATEGGSGQEGGQQGQQGGQGSQSGAQGQQNQQQQNQGQQNQGQQGQQAELTDEQIQTKLDALSNKQESELTDEDKAFIEKYTAEELDEINATRQALETRYANYGVKLEGQYTNDEAGLAQLTDDAAYQVAQKQVDAYFTQVPALAEFYQHVIKEGRSIETLIEKSRTPEFKTVKLEQTSDSNDEGKNNTIIANQKKILSMHLASKGLTPDDIETFTTLYEDKGTLYDKAKEAYQALEKGHKERVDATLKAEQDRIEAEQKEIKETFDKVVKMVDTNNFGGLSIPAADLKLFKEALTKTDREGYTLIQHKRANLSLEQRVLLDYFVFKDLKVANLQTAQAANRKFTFKNRAEQNNERGGGRLSGANGAQGGSTQQGMPQFDMSKIKVDHQFIQG